jgi:hypothetical protein
MKNLMLPGIINVVQSRRLWRAGYVAWIWETKNAYRMLARKTIDERSHGKLHKQECNSRCM